MFSRLLIVIFKYELISSSGDWLIFSTYNYLETLTLFFNDNIISPIPTEFGKLTNLGKYAGEFRRKSCDLRESAPSPFVSLARTIKISHSVDMDLSYTQLTGGIPSELGNLQKLGKYRRSIGYESVRVSNHTNKQ